MKIIQISATSYVNEAGESFTYVFGLGDDGLLYKHHNDGEWYRT